MQGKQPLANEAANQSRAVANDQRKGGMSLPAVPAFQRTAFRPPPNQTTNVFQLQALIAGKPYERLDLLKLTDTQVAAYNNPVLADVVKYSLFPMLENEVWKFQDMDLFNLQFQSYLRLMDEHIMILLKGSLPEIIQHEIKFQQLVDKYPMLTPTLTTCGFEFEFLQATEDSVLAGISHLELAATKETFGKDKRAFKVETDSSRELELVTPPFLIPTIGTASFPHPEMIRRIDQLFKTDLLKLQAYAFELSQKSGEWGLQGVLGELSKIIGLQIYLKPDTIGPSNVSYNLGEKGKTAVREGLTPKDLAGMKFNEKNEKYASKGIDIASQVNFAADAETLGILLAMKDLKDDPTFAPLYAEWHRYFKTKAPKLPIDYVEHLLQKLVSLYAVPMQQIVLEELTKIYTEIKTGLSGPKKLDQPIFEMLAGFISYIKDIKPVWVKDDLANITKAYLFDDEVLKTMKTFTIDDFPFKVLIDSMFKRGAPEIADTISAQYKGLCVLGFKTINMVCVGPYPEDPPTAVNFLEHSKTHVGGRQDTYIYLNKLTAAKKEKRRYVGEIRDGDIKGLQEMAKELMQQEEVLYGKNVTIDDLAYKERSYSKLKEKVQAEYHKLYKIIPDDSRKKKKKSKEPDPMADLLQSSDLLLPIDYTPPTRKKKKKRKKEKDKGKVDD